jgi:hypothetical protein
MAVAVRVVADVLQQSLPHAAAEIVRVDIHDAQSDMALAGMVEARAHQPAGTRVFRNHAAARLERVVGIVENFGDLGTSAKDLGQAVVSVPGVDRGVNQFGNFGAVCGADGPQMERRHRKNPFERNGAILPEQARVAKWRGRTDAAFLPGPSTQLKYDNPQALGDQGER